MNPLAHSPITDANNTQLTPDKFQRTYKSDASNSSAILTPGISELIIPNWEQASFELVLPMLAHLSTQADDRWLTWIGQTLLTKQAIQNHSFASEQVRMIQSGNDDEALWMMWEALNNGTSTFVVGCFHHHTVQAKERSFLDTACQSGYSRGLIIKLPPKHYT